MPSLPRLIASSFAVLCGRYGDVIALAQQRAESRVALDRQAYQVIRGSGRRGPGR